MSWNLLVILLSGCLLLTLTWFEVTRKNRARLALRLLATLLMTASLAGITVPLSFPTHQSNAAPTVAVLLTEGHDRDSLRNFLATLDYIPPVLSLENTAPVDPALRARTLFGQDSLQFFAEQHSLHVFGWGFDAQSRQLLDGRSFTLHLPAAQRGFTGVHWPASLPSGEHLVVQGRFRNSGNQAATLLLEGLSARLDSCVVRAGSDTFFTLTTVPKLRGKGLYSLSAFSGGKLLEQEPIPLQVDSLAAIKVLLLSATPDFENKFLKTWLSSHGYSVDIRTRISTDRYNRVYVNGTDRELGQLTPSLLQQYDVVVSDPGSLSGLSPAEQQSLQRSINVRGLGLIVRADSLLPRSFFGAFFPLSGGADSTPKSMPLLVNNLVSDTLQWLAEQPLFIQSKPGTQPFVTTASSVPVAAGTLLGAGKVVLTTVNNSFNWLLKGNDKAYASFWSLLIRKALPAKPASLTWQFSPSLPVAGEPVQATLETDQAETPRERVCGYPAAFIQDPQLPFRWTATVWPGAGWQTAGNGPSAHQWYVYKHGDWLPARAAERVRDNKQYLATAHLAKEPVQGPAPSRKAFPRAVFFFLFLVSAGFLWIEKKFM